MALLALLSWPFLTITGSVWGETNCPHWRGPRHDGTSGAKDLPMEWSATENVVSASSVLAENKLHILNENAVTSIVSVGPEFKLLATNDLDGSYTLASPAVSGSHLFIRTSTHPYCIGE